MIDREKVVKGLQCLARTREPASNPCKDCGYVDSPNFAICVVDVAIDALELLKNEPLPVLNVGKYGVYYGDCPACGKRIYYKISRFCPHCGQAVKWDDT